MNDLCADAQQHSTTGSTTVSSPVGRHRRWQTHLKRSAWVLTENLPKASYDSIRSFSARQIPTFATREEAMEYLVS